MVSSLPPVVSALSVMLIPVVGVFSGAWLLGEQPASADYVALVMMLAAIGLTLIPSRSGVARPANRTSVAQASDDAHGHDLRGLQSAGEQDRPAVDRGLRGRQGGAGGDLA